EPEIALVTAGVETDVLGIGRDSLPAEAIQEVTEAHPRPDFKNRILRAFTDGMKHRPRTTFGTVNADVLAHFDKSFTRDDFVEIIRTNSWPE
ncbi:MAG TPA: diguanylate cyclase, partial [Mycobacterium sp.]|nr:diguanylate cyclase [Mycobacterium sp.]